jgi:hypothetical protein
MLLNFLIKLQTCSIPEEQYQYATGNHTSLRPQTLQFSCVLIWNYSVSC